MAGVRRGRGGAETEGEIVQAVDAWAGSRRVAERPAAVVLARQARRGVPCSSRRSATTRSDAGAAAQRRGLGLRVEAAIPAPSPQRRAVNNHVDVHRRAHDHASQPQAHSAPQSTTSPGTSSRTWTLVYFTGGDPDAVRAARAARRRWFATARELPTLVEAGRGGWMLSSAAELDPGETYEEGCSRPATAHLRSQPQARTGGLVTEGGEESAATRRLAVTRPRPGHVRRRRFLRRRGDLRAGPRPVLGARRSRLPPGAPPAP